MLTWEPVIGLEVHVQLATRTKIFCRCENRFGAEPNSLVCQVCLGYPGALPVLNPLAVDLAASLALALECEVHELSEFARKNYFYPDLPKGYQISQYDRPLAERGRLALPGGGRSIRIHRLHLEEDAGKLLHELPAAMSGLSGPGAGRLADASLVDFNRCGVPLVEIVTEPDLSSPEEAEAFLRALHQLLLYTRASDGNMEEGSLRCDANISLRPAGAATLGVKTEIKNLNSFRHVARALAHEIARQRALLESGGTVVQETRGWEDERGVTYSQRGKEAAHDYRYFPDPDLPRVALDAARLAAIRAALPELPAARRARYVAAFGLGAAEADELTADRELADYFEGLVAAVGGLPPRAASNWLRNEILRELKERRIDIASAPPPRRTAAVLALVESGTISLVAARQVLAAVWEGAEEPAAAAERLGLLQIRDESQLAAWVSETIAAFPEQVAELRAGKLPVLAFLTGQVMKRSRGRADARRVQELLKSELGAAAESPPR